MYKNVQNQQSTYNSTLTLSRHIPDEIKNVQNKLNGTSYQPLIIHKNT